MFLCLLLWWSTLGSCSRWSSGSSTASGGRRTHMPSQTSHSLYCFHFYFWFSTCSTGQQSIIPGMGSIKYSECKHVAKTEPFKWIFTSMKYTLYQTIWIILPFLSSIVQNSRYVYFSFRAISYAESPSVNLCTIWRMTQSDDWWSDDCACMKQAVIHMAF